MAVRQPSNRAGWARTYMKKAELVDPPRRGHFTITPRGLEALQENPKTINVKFLERYPEFQEFRTRSTLKARKGGGIKGEVPPEQTPVEAIETAYETIRSGLVDELLEQVWDAPPTSSSGWWSTSWCGWATAAQGGTRLGLWARAVMRV